MSVFVCFRFDRLQKENNMFYGNGIGLIHFYNLTLSITYVSMICHSTYSDRVWKWNHYSIRWTLLTIRSSIRHILLRHRPPQLVIIFYFKACSGIPLRKIKPKHSNELLLHSKFVEIKVSNKSWVISTKFNHSHINLVNCSCFII